MQLRYDIRVRYNYNLKAEKKHISVTLNKT